VREVLRRSKARLSEFQLSIRPRNLLKTKAFYRLRQAGHAVVVCSHLLAAAGVVFEIGPLIAPSTHAPAPIPAADQPVLLLLI
jgi:hypothetical protein